MIPRHDMGGDNQSRSDQWHIGPHQHTPRHISTSVRMEQGKAAQAAIETLEKRGRFREYGLSEGKGHFGLSLSSSELGISGKLDLLIETPDGCYPSISNTRLAGPTTITCSSWPDTHLSLPNISPGRFPPDSSLSLPTTSLSVSP